MLTRPLTASNLMCRHSKKLGTVRPAIEPPSQRVVSVAEFGETHIYFPAAGCRGVDGAGAFRPAIQSRR